MFLNKSLQIRPFGLFPQTFDAARIHPARATRRDVEPKWYREWLTGRQSKDQTKSASKHTQKTQQASTN